MKERGYKYDLDLDLIHDLLKQLDDETMNDETMDPDFPLELNKFLEENE